MAEDIKRYVVSCISALVASIIAYYATQYSSELRIPAMVITTIIAFLISNTIFISSKLDKMKLAFEDFNLGKFEMRHVSDQVDALEYVIANASKCKSIRNTRLSPPEQAGMWTLGDKLQKHDEAVINAVKRGCAYSLVYEKASKEHALTQAQALQAAKGNPNTGRASFYEVDARNAPLLQMIILEYWTGEKEALVGWIIGNAREPTAPVYFFKSKTNEEDPVDLFERLFAMYQNFGTVQRL